MKKLAHFIVLTFLVFGPAAQAQTCNRQQDSLALVGFYNAMGGPGWTIQWNFAQPMNTWFGVVLTPAGCVKSLDILAPLTGIIPNLQLPFLEKLSLNSVGLSSLTGSIPNFSGLANLQEFSLSGSDSLTGPIPNFSNLPKLSKLELSLINFPGSIPDFSELPQLKTLIFNNNDLQGPLPDFQNMPSLEELDLSNNHFSGPLIEFSNLPVLKKLILARNNLSGAIPDFQTLENLEVLNLSGNADLEGNIPDFQHLPKLKELYLGGSRDLVFTIIVNIIVVSQSELNGTIPDFSKLPQLERLYIEYVKCTGPIPDFSNLPNLKNLNITGRQLSGSIPDFSNLPLLDKLTLGGYEEEVYIFFAKIPIYYRSNISGAIPDFSNLPQLVELDLRYGLLSGEVPDFSNLPVAEKIWLAHNLLGPDLTDFSNLPEAGLIDLSVNAFKGTIPGFSQLPELGSLRLDNNKLDSLGMLMNTSGKVSLSGNRLTFDDLLPNLDRISSYAPQDTMRVCVTATAVGGLGPVLDLGFDAGLTTNIYNWYLDETLMATTIENEWKPDFAPEDADTFRVTVTNTEAPDLTLITKQFAIVSLCDTIDATIDPVFGEADLLLFPNPASEYLNLLWNGPSMSDVHLRLVHMTGGVVWEEKAAGLEEGTSRQIPLGHAAQGSYMFQVHSRRGTISRLVMVLRDY